MVEARKGVESSVGNATRAVLGAFKTSEWFADALNEYSLAFSQGEGDLATDDVEQLTGKPARSYDAFARDYAEVFKGAQKVA